MAVLAHAVVVGGLVVGGREILGPPRGGWRASRDARVNFFAIPAGAPAAVDMALPPRLTLSDLSALRRIHVELPPLELPAATLPTPMAALAGGGGNTGGGGGGRGAGPGGAVGVGAGSGTGDEASYIFPASPRTAILPPLARVPGSVVGRTYHVKFWVSVEGRVTRVDVVPPIADAAYGREFQQRMMAYQFYPAHTRDGRNVTYVVTVPLRIGN
ncbi:MAG: hypothetical protein DMD56_12775 [Gemmatimonadetes bacterium]|nr:MAG: hypothetical protein DMD56_12775 [Gemmatimonadota bacterium]